MKISELNKLYDAHLEREEEIWKDLRYKIIKKYMDIGYWRAWAEVKADQEIWELRSQPINSLSMNIPQEQTLQGDLD
jgi:hypothetical protein